MRLRVFSALLAMMTTANAASIVVLPLGQNKSSLVVITGTIDLADKDEFLRKIAPLQSAIVSFSSDGGSLLAGLQIGETIRLKNFSTLVPDQARCASSCALAWLGGTRRFMGSRAQVGFHAAYDGQTHEVTSSGNALMGAYLNKIGLPYSAVIYITSAAPDSISWLSKPDAEKLGIEVSLFNTTAAPNPKGRDNAPATGAYVVQVSSQRSDENARAAYQVLQAKYPMLLRSYLPIIYRSDLGDKGIFYRAAVGPFQTAEEASQFCGDLKTAGGQCVVQRNTPDVSPRTDPPAANPPPPTGRLVLPTAISPKYSTENEGEARMHTCLDQYIANKVTNGNGGMKWIDKGGGYYSECNKKLKG
jgi:SPOR domain